MARMVTLPKCVLLNMETSPKIPFEEVSQQLICFYLSYFCNFVSRDLAVKFLKCIFCFIVSLHFS